MIDEIDRFDRTPVSAFKTPNDLSGAQSGVDGLVKELKRKGNCFTDRERKGNELINYLNDVMWQANMQKDSLCTNLGIGLIVSCLGLFFFLLVFVLYKPEVETTTSAATSDDVEWYDTVASISLGLLISVFLYALAAWFSYDETPPCCCEKPLDRLYNVWRKVQRLGVWVAINSLFSTVDFVFDYLVVFDFFVQGEFVWAFFASFFLVIHLGWGAIVVFRVHRDYSKCTETKSKCHWFWLCVMTSTDMELLTLWDWTPRTVPPHVKFDSDLFQRLHLPTQDLFHHVLNHTLFENVTQVVVLLLYLCFAEDAQVSPISMCSLLLSLCWLMVKAAYWTKSLRACSLKEESQGGEGSHLKGIPLEEVPVCALTLRTCTCILCDICRNIFFKSTQRW